MALSFTLGSPKAQIITYQTALKDSTLNILYTNFNNTIEIKNLPESSQVKFNNANIDPYASDLPDCKQFSLFVDAEGVSSLQVFNSKNDEIYSKEFRAIKSNDLVLRLGNIKDTVATVAEILEYPAVVLYIPGSYLKQRMAIPCYTITLIRDLDVLTTNKSGRGKNFNDVAFDDDIQEEIGKMKRGDKIFIENIKAIGPDMTTRGLAPVVVTIK